MFPLSAILALRDSRIHIGPTYYSSMASDIEAPVD